MSLRIIIVLIFRIIIHGICTSWWRHDMECVIGPMWHYSDVIMRAVASQITDESIVCSTVRSGADKKHIKAPRHCSLWFPPQRVSNAENVSIWWRHHEETIGHRFSSHSAIHMIQRCGRLMFSLLFELSCWTISPITGDLRRIDAHVMSL